MVNLFAAVSAGINALWDASHGGANQEVIEMLAEIRDEGISARASSSSAAKSRDQHGAPDGLPAIASTATSTAHEDHQEGVHEVLENSGCTPRLLRDRDGAREIALKRTTTRRAQALPERRLLTPGVIYKRDSARGQHVQRSFALGRLPGWISQWMELHGDPDFKIGPAPDLHRAESDRTTSRSTSLKS